MIEKANLAEKLRLFSDRFAPRTVSQFNGHDVMVAKLKGPFVWHRHDDTDDFFLVLEGTLDIELRDRTVTLGAGEVFVVPRGGWSTGRWRGTRFTCSSSSRPARTTRATRARQPGGKRSERPPRL